MPLEARFLASSIVLVFLAGGNVDGAELVDPNVQNLDIAFGLTATTDYVSRGASNSNGEPAIQGYIEPFIGLDSIGVAYFSIFASNVDFGPGFQGTEIDLSGGIKRWDDPEEKFWFDIGYIHYFYAPSSVSPDYGEVYAKIQQVEDRVSFGAEVDFAPDYLQGGYTATYLEGDLEIELAPKVFLVGAVGYQFFGDPGFADYLNWTTGIKLELEPFTISVTYADTDLSSNQCVAVIGVEDACDARAFVTLSFDALASGWTANESR